MFFQVKLARFILLSGFIFSILTVLTASVWTKYLSLALHAAQAEAQVVGIDTGEVGDTTLPFRYRYRVASKVFGGSAPNGSPDMQVGDLVHVYYSAVDPGLSSTSEPVTELICAFFGASVASMVMSMHMVFRPHRSAYRRFRMRRKI